MSVPTSGMVTVDVHLDERDLRAALERDVRAGLSAPQKQIPPTWFYDDQGSRLFEEITRLPEYYPTRAERALLEHHALEIATRSGADSLVELGAGSCEKTRLLLDALAEAGPLSHYVPFDVSADFLRHSARSIADEYPDVRVHAVVGDFLVHAGRIPSTGRRLVAFLGGTIGNLVPPQRERFLLDVNAAMSYRDTLLLGTDLVKDRRRIVAAYDDASGVTARFNRNVLTVMNHALGADFVPERFEHVARWIEPSQWVEMRLRATQPETVTIEQLGMTVTFEEGEELRTEISAKFTPGGVARELAQSGFVVDRQWGAEDGEFLLTLARPST